MKFAASRILTIARIAAYVLGCALWGPQARSQQSPEGPQVSQPAPYHDRYIAGGNLALDISTDDSATSDPAGLARALRIEGIASLLTDHGGGGSSGLHESGVLFDAQWDTRSYGAWSANAAERIESASDSASRGSRGVFRLVERAMPFDGGWSADAAIGDLNGPSINLARLQSRFFLPSAPLQGAATEWRGPQGLQLVADAGEPGVYEGIAVPGFEALGGATGTVGAQWSPGSHWTVGGELTSAHDVRSFTGMSTADSDRASATTGFLSTAWQGASARAQLNLADGSLPGRGNALGAWLDTSIDTGHVSQNLGVFRIEPNLTWGNQLITNDVQGGYYQLDYQSRRWFADLAVDQAWSVSGRGLNSTFVATDARYQLSRDFGAGGAVNLRRSDAHTAWSAQSYFDVRNDLGIARGQLEYGDDEAERDAAIVVSQSLDLASYSHLSASIGYETAMGTDGSKPTLSSAAVNLAINGAVDLSARLSVNGNMRWDHTVNGPRASSSMAGVTLNWQMTRDWTVLASYYENRVGSWTALTVTSALAPPTATTTPAANQHAVFLTFRYQRSAGQHFAPLGGGPGSGSGQLTGTLYLDSNDNGCFDAGEAIAPNVTIILDSRFSTITDRNGHFDFPAVSAGHHYLTVIPDNLPLPWMVSHERRIEVEVRTRDHTDVSIPAVRQSVLTRQGN